MAYLLCQAQDELVIKGTKQIRKKLTPQQVIDSLESRFPDAKSVKYYKVPSSQAKTGWAVTEEDDMEADEDIDYYTISFKRDDFRYYGLYKPDGTLVMSKMEEKVTTLPVAVAQSVKSLSTQYPGYVVNGETHFRRLDHSKNKEYYEITAKKGKENKKFFFSPEGELMKVKG
jgi:hypothetical protein